MSMIHKFKGEYYFLSNFYACEIEMDGKTYPSVEHAYQAAKSLSPSDRTLIRNQYSPKEAKKYGRLLVAIRPDWESIRINTMENLVRQKFQDPVLSFLLVDTGEADIVEGNSWGDQFWGKTLPDMRGENHLGIILMKVREEIKHKEE